MVESAVSAESRTHELDEILRLWSVPIGTPLPGGSAAGRHLFVPRRPTYHCERVSSDNAITVTGCPIMTGAPRTSV
jgi:hypothetical protein